MDYYARRWANPFRNQGFEAYKGLFQYFEEEGAYVMHSTRDPAWYYDPWQQIVYGGLLLYLMGPLLVQFMSPVAIMTTAGLLAAPAWVVRAIEFRKEEKRLNVSCDSLPHQGPLFELSGVARRLIVYIESDPVSFWARLFIRPSSDAANAWRSLS